MKEHAEAAQLYCQFLYININNLHDEKYQKYILKKGESKRGKKKGSKVIYSRSFKLLTLYRMEYEFTYSWITKLKGQSCVCDRCSWLFFRRFTRDIRWKYHTPHAEITINGNKKKEKKNQISGILWLPPWLKTLADIEVWLTTWHL